MIIKTGNIKLRITKNRNNKFWTPIGQFWNITEIIINDEWYECTLRYLKKEEQYFIQFRHPMKVDKKTSIITEIFCEGIYQEVQTSIFKFNLIKYLENTHTLNDTSYNIRKAIFDRRRTVLIFSFALIPSILFYLLNANYNNIIIHLIAENTWVQTLFFFLTISGFINIFQPFSIKKEISKQDIENIAKKVIENEKTNENIKRRASF